jgi:hypothetical protein
MRHTQVLIHADDLAARLWSDADNQTDEAADVERLGGWWSVGWPEHVITPRYNGDCSYGHVGNHLTGEIVADYADHKAYGDPLSRTVGELNQCGQLYQMSSVPLSITHLD